MKVFALLFFVGCALATQSEWRWESGKQHVFEYQGRLLTGIPQLASHFSGLGINATVLVDVLSSNKLQLSLERPRFVRVNERLEARMNSQDGLDGANWREVYLPQMQEVSAEYKQILEQPIIFELVEGEIREAKISKEEPEWAVNFKKALALLFQTKFDAASWQPEENQISQANSENFWKTKEEGIDGICEVTYQINELPKYMVVDKPEMVPYPEECRGQKYYEVTKIKNVDNCERRSAFSYYKPGFFKCNGPNCKNMWARTSETRFIACGTRGNLMIQSIINHGELTQNLLGIKTEKVVSGNLQILRLKEVRSASPRPAPRDLVELKNMMYEYHYLSYQNPTAEQQEELRHSRIPKDVLRNAELLGKILPTSKLQGQKEPLPASDIKQKVKALMQSVIREMSAPQAENLSEKQVTLKVLSAARGLSMLKKSDLETVYEELKQEFASDEVHKSIAKNLFYDTVMMSATPESIRFLKDQMINNEMTKLELFSLFIWMPNNLMVPHEQLLEEIFELVTSPQIQNNKMSQNVATMSFSTLLEKACLARNRKTAYPTWVVGTMCTPESKILKEKWVPFLLKELEQSQDWMRKNDIIVALGLLPSQDLVGRLVPILEGRVQNTEVPRMTRLLALWSLSNIAVQQPEIIEPIYFAIFSNPAESTEMRISAFNALLKVNPSISTFHKIAARTWTEQDKEVLAAVNTAFFTLSREPYVKVINENIEVMNLAKKAELVYPLIKKYNHGIFFVSASLFGADYLPHLDTGYEGIGQWIASKKSFLPRDVYWQLTYFLSQYQFNFIQNGYHLEGVENIYRRVAQLLVPQKPGQSVEQEREQVAQELQQNLNSQWRQLAQKLNIKSRDEDDKISAAGFFRIQEAAPVFGNFHELTVETLKEKINEIFSNPQAIKDKINAGEHRLNFRRTVDASPFMGLIPTDMGFPLNVEFHNPVMVSLDSKIKASMNWLNPKMEMQSRVFFTAQYVGWVGTMIPFTKEWAATVIDQTKMYNLPATIKIELEPLSQQVKMSVAMDKDMRTPLDLVHQHVHPFTAIQKVDDLTPITLATERKMIESRDQVKELKKVFGESLGLHMMAEVKTESRFLDMRSVVEKLRLFNYNIFNMYMFSWADFALSSEGKTSVRRHQFTLRLNPTESVTKEMTFVLKAGVASKAQESNQVQYHKVKVLSPAEQEQEAQKEACVIKKQLRRIVPYSYESQALEAKSMHPERQTQLEQVLKSIAPQFESLKSLVIKVSATIVGPRPQTWSYVATAVQGSKPEITERKFQTKWHLEMESKQTQDKVVFEGRIQAPVLPVWDIHAIRSSMIDYNTFASFQYFKAGSKDWSIDVDTKAATSHEQKEWSRQSPEAKLCQTLTQRQASGEQIYTVVKHSQACEAMRQQARALDEVLITVKYNNVPRYIEIAEAKCSQMMKTLLWPFMRMDYENSQVGDSIKSIKTMPVYARLRFNKLRPSFDMTVTRPQEKMHFKDIRMPTILSRVLPLKAGVNNIKLAAQMASSNSLFPVCKVEKKAMQTFDNKSLPIELDQCFHLVAADCSEQMQFGVLARVLSEQGQAEQKEVQVFLGKSEILLTPISNGQIRIKVDGQEVQIKPQQWQELKSAQQEVLGQVLRAPNGVIEISAPQYMVSLTFDGRDLAVETSQVVKGMTCGLCGNQNQDLRDEVDGPKACLYSRPEIKAAAYRIESHPQGCDSQKPLSQHIKQRLEQENQQCLKEKVIPTKISKSLKTQNGPCTILKQAVIRKPGQICISKKAVTQCAAGCQPSHAELLEKQIAFTCLKEDRVAEHYAKKAERGERMSELEARPTSFETKVPQPRSCVPASNEL